LGIPLITLFLIEKIYFFNGLFLLIPIALTFAYSFVINDYFDHIIFKEKNYLKNIVKSLGKKKTLFLSILPLAGIFVFFAFFSSFLPTALLGTIIIFYTLYSVPPFQLKRNYIFSLVINSLSIGVLPFLFVLSFYGIYPEQALAFSILFFIYIFFHEIIHQISHFKNDKRNGIKSLPAVYGLKSSILVAKTSLITSVLVGTFFILINPSSNFIFIITVLFSLYRLLRLSKLPLDYQRFSLLRNRFYGIQEGITYLIVILLI
jgi:4-hydroxybenzoate polyprenyltransferase